MERCAELGRGIVPIRQGLGLFADQDKNVFKKNQNSQPVKKIYFLPAEGTLRGS